LTAAAGRTVVGWQLVAGELENLRIDAHIVILEEETLVFETCTGDFVEEALRI
jgi:hypothetical protein